MTKYVYDDSPYYTDYITRGGAEYEVTAQLYDHGKAEEGYDRWTGGHWMEVVEDPVFTEFVAFDEYGVEMTLTPKEIFSCDEQMIRQYWDNNQ